MGEQSPEPDFAADEIPVAKFREILIWPLALHLRPASTEAMATQNEVTRAVDNLTFAKGEHGTKWVPVDDPSEHIAAPACDTDRKVWDAHRYQEAVYFHDFVQSFLFSPRFPRSPCARDAGEPDPVPFRLFRRTDVVGATVELGRRSDERAGRMVHLTVERLNLYLFRSGAAILVLEVVTKDQTLPLSAVQDFLDQFRRAYGPYAEFKRPPGAPETAPEVPSAPSSLVVQSVTWLLQNGQAKFEIDSDAVAGMMKRYIEQTEDDDDSGLRRRSPPLFKHWQWLLDNALPLASDPPNPGRKARWHHVVDERMATVTAVSVTPPTVEGSDPLHFRHYFDRTSRGDLVRLCFADRSGSDRLPYQEKFLSTFEADHAYEAFRDEGTLFLVSGYAFTAYGAGWFFDNIVSAVHIRRHYFQIGLLSHLELASLLSFSSRISRAVAEFRAGAQAPQRFELVMQSIQDEFLQFLHRFRFTGASNHLQARELTDRWRRHLRLHDIYHDLHTEITSATSYLFNRATSRGASTAEQLQMIGLFAVIFGLTFSFLSISTVDWQRLFCVLAFAAWTGLVGLKWLEATQQRFIGEGTKAAMPEHDLPERRLAGSHAGFSPVSTRIAKTFIFWLAILATGLFMLSLAIRR